MQFLVGDCQPSGVWVELLGEKAQWIFSGHYLHWFTLSPVLACHCEHKGSVSVAVSLRITRQLLVSCVWIQWMTIGVDAWPLHHHLTCWSVSGQSPGCVPCDPRSYNIGQNLVIPSWLLAVVCCPNSVLTSTLVTVYVDDAGYTSCCHGINECFFVNWWSWKLFVSR